jgi:hypothetical protein
MVTVEDEPKSCADVPLRADLERVVRDAYAAEFVCRVDALGVPATDIRVELFVSAEEVAQQTPWLHFNASDGTTCYDGWDGDCLKAVSVAKPFGQTIADSFAALGQQHGRPGTGRSADCPVFLALDRPWSAWWRIGSGRATHAEAEIVRGSAESRWPTG